MKEFTKMQKRVIRNNIIIEHGRFIEEKVLSMNRLGFENKDIADTLKISECRVVTILGRQKNKK